MRWSGASAPRDPLADAGGAHVYDEGGPWWKSTQISSMWELIFIVAGR
jgi:hypothetical protein